MTADEFKEAFSIAMSASRNMDEFEVHNKIIDTMAIDPTFEDSETIISIITTFRDDDKKVRTHCKNFLNLMNEMEAKKNGR